MTQCQDRMRTVVHEREQADDYDLLKPVVEDDYDYLARETYIDDEHGRPAYRIHLVSYTHPTTSQKRLAIVYHQADDLFVYDTAADGARVFDAHRFYESLVREMTDSFTSDDPFTWDCTDVPGVRARRTVHTDHALPRVTRRHPGDYTLWFEGDPPRTTTLPASQAEATLSRQYDVSRAEAAHATETAERG